MKVLGFNFSKMSVEKMSDKIKELKINTNIDIKEIVKIENTMLTSSNTLLGIKFKHYLNYDPEIAKIDFSGNILIELEDNEAKDVLEGWKDKKLKEEFKMPLFNLILRKSSIKAIQFEDEVGLPLHFQLPSIKSKKE